MERISSLPWEAIEPEADFAELLDTTFVDSLRDRDWNATVAVETVAALAQKIGRESCSKCHLVHVPAALSGVSRR